jgi:hypothetical protein
MEIKCIPEKWNEFEMDQIESYAVWNVDTHEMWNHLFYVLRLVYAVRIQ